MRDNMLAVRVFEKKYANGSAYDVVISELFCKEWMNRCNAPTFVLFINEDVDAIEKRLTGETELRAKLHLTGLVEKGVQIDNPVTVTKRFVHLSQLFRMVADYNLNKDKCRKARAGGCSVQSFETYNVNPKDVKNFGHKVIRFSTAIVNLKAVK